VIPAGQAATPLEPEAGLGAQRHNGASGGAASTATHQAPPGSVDSSYDRIHRNRREQPALVINPADDGGFGRDLHGSGDKARAEDRPADDRLVKYEIPGEETGIRVRMHRERPVQGHAHRIVADREKSPDRVPDLSHERPLHRCSLYRAGRLCPVRECA
jgi:hypothetical protein